MSDRKTNRPNRTEIRRAVKGVRKFALKQKSKGLPRETWTSMTPKGAR
jgi:hypothetical protein